MKKIALYGAVVSVAVSSLAGCALAQTAPNPCNGGNCQVQVTIGSGCSVTAAPTELHVSPGTTPATIVFHVSGGRFAKDNGIYIKHNGDPDNQVTSLAESGPTWVMQERRTAGKRITYGVMTVEANGRACPPLDPIIVNDTP